MDEVQQLLNWFDHQPLFYKTPTLSRMKMVLSALDHPEQACQYVHVTGTNGKGSTIAYLSSLLKQDVKVGVFTSPHWEVIYDRIRINDVPINAEDFFIYLSRLKTLSTQLVTKQSMDPLTQFELLTLVMFLYFKDTCPDIVLLEVGIGGQWDSTNIIKHPLLTIITSISLDHEAILGDDLSKITLEKSGILKPHVPLISGVLPKQAQDVLSVRTRSLHCPWWQLNQNFRTTLLQMTDQGTTFIYEDDHLKLEVKIPLLGRYQIDNAAVALCAYQYLMCNVFKQPLHIPMIKKGFLNTYWPGRMQKVFDQPPIYLDGAHNIAAIEQFISLWPSLFYSKAKQWYFFVGILNTKEAHTMISLLKQLPHVTLIFCVFSDQRSLTFDVYQKYMRDFDKITDHWYQLYQDVVTQKDIGIFFMGSLSFISEVNLILNKEEL